MRTTVFQFAPIAVAAMGLVAMTASCDGSGDGPTIEPEGEPDPIVCTIVDDETPPFLERLGCAEDFDAMASKPLDTSIPGARSAKVVLDRFDGGLYVQQSETYQIHHAFCSAHLSGGDRPFVGDLAAFNATEYFSPDRRFVLAALTHYAGPDVFALEFSPYDTVDATMAKTLFDGLQAQTPFVDIRFHPTSEQVALNVASAALPTVTTSEIFDGIDYQPLNLATAIGKLRFVRAEELETTYLDFRDLVVLDKVPNDISVVLGIVTEEFQTPLSHINVLSQNRGTPNMGLRGAQTHPELVALEGKFVSLTVGAFDFEVHEVTQAEADAWYDANRPETVQVPAKDLSVDRVTPIVDVLDPATDDMRRRIAEKIPAFGGKAAHYAELAALGNQEEETAVPVPDGFVVPIFFYDQHLRTNGLDQVVSDLVNDSRFDVDAEFRDAGLRALREQIETAPINDGLIIEIENQMFRLGLRRARFRSSTNAEDLEGFTGAGLYTSKSGEIGNADKTIANAVRKVWASVWFLRAVDERRFRGIAHEDVGMALLAHRSFPDEYANGVALTANPFDPTGLEPAFYINVQRGEDSVVKPEPGVTTDQILYQYDRPGQPAVYLGRSNSSLLDDGESVLSNAELFELGAALQAIHLHFAAAYGPNAPGANANGFYGMDVEFKFDVDTDGNRTLFVKQARPHPGRGQ